MSTYKIKKSKSANDRAYSIITNGIDKLKTAKNTRLRLMDRGDLKIGLNYRDGYICARLYEPEELDLRRQGGLLLTDGKKEYLAHSGIFSGVKGKSIKDYVFNHTKFPETAVTLDGEEYNVLIIGALKDKNFHAWLERFVSEILIAKDVHARPQVKKKKQEQQKSDLKKIESNKIDKTERVAIIKARCNQGKFRKAVLKYSNGKCLFTGVEDTRLLIAGHIKPWAKCTKKEKLCPENGLALTPLYDWLFDKNLISFDKKGRLLVSKTILKLSPILGLKSGHLYLQKEEMKMREKFLAFHRSNFK